MYQYMAQHRLSKSTLHSNEHWASLLRAINCAFPEYSGIITTRIERRLACLHDHLRDRGLIEQKGIGRHATTVWPEQTRERILARGWMGDLSALALPLVADMGLVAEETAAGKPAFSDYDPSISDLDRADLASEFSAALSFSDTHPYPGAKHHGHLARYCPSPPASPSLRKARIRGLSHSRWADVSSVQPTVVGRHTSGTPFRDMDFGTDRGSIQPSIVRQSDPHSFEPADFTDDDGASIQPSIVRRRSPPVERVLFPPAKPQAAPDVPLGWPISPYSDDSDMDSSVSIPPPLFSGSRPRRPVSEVFELPGSDVPTQLHQHPQRPQTDDPRLTEPSDRCQPSLSSETDQQHETDTLLLERWRQANAKQRDNEILKRLHPLEQAAAAVEVAELDWCDLFHQRYLNWIRMSLAVMDGLSHPGANMGCALDKLQVVCAQAMADETSDVMIAAAGRSAQCRQSYDALKTEVARHPYFQ
ncbi:uncharacterized protein F5Z01DRAFT_639933 [Emericellopsis atlantica]|uniref:Uncharacterized protein n=1 Tax=Emericellopsis atlantica TaxID=2614577 RepID=A0A9P8CLC2_9HYPO|nr:uncharacterized protein F5Z01DRAFT_639933 [Emericellopsis atlantica]KAG9250845.1 hypothetical protein F5Z01DRAFT_639933 [Emericellopsis atlantica]